MEAFLYQPNHSQTQLRTNLSTSLLTWHAFGDLLKVTDSYSEFFK